MEHNSQVSASPSIFFCLQAPGMILPYYDCDTIHFPGSTTKKTFEEYILTSGCCTFKTLQSNGALVYSVQIIDGDKVVARYITARFGSEEQVPVKEREILTLKKYLLRQGLLVVTEEHQQQLKDVKTEKQLRGKQRAVPVFLRGGSG